MTSQRRLAAILAADVVGFSRLMEHDEAGTLAALKSRRADILAPLVARHHGRVVKLMGDGVLVEFGSAVNAVQCAVALQAGFGAANDGTPEGRRIVLRIGINLGDVIVEGSDLYGDGVNIAARLEALAEPGGIYLSGAVHDQVKRKLDLGFDDLGPQLVKNLAEPLRVFRVAGAAAPIASPPPAIKTAIAVLPFANMSDDADQTYFSDGITEDIITELSRFRDWRIASRNASFRYRDAADDPARIGRELAVQYLLKGSVRRAGKRIRITAQLTDIQTGSDIWAEKFDRDQEDLFAVQDEVARVIVATLVGRIEDAVTTGAKRKPPTHLAAYECVLQAEPKQYTGTAGLLEARRLLEQAVAIDPGYALAYSHLANTYRLEWFTNFEDSDHLLDQALAYVRQALALDEDHDGCHTDLGLILMNRNEWELAEHHLRRALALNPNSPVGIMCLGFLHTYLGKTDTALELFESARALDPFFEPTWFWRMQGGALFVARRYQDSITALRKSATLAAWAHAYVAAAFACLDQFEQAKAHVDEALRLAPDFTIRRAVAKEPFKQPADRQHLIDAMRRAGLPE